MARRQRRIRPATFKAQVAVAELAETFEVHPGPDCTVESVASGA